MRSIAFVVFIHIASSVFAQQVGPSTVPETYARFQGEWSLPHVYNDKGVSRKDPSVRVKVTGRKFELSGADISDTLSERSFRLTIPATATDNPYRHLKARGAQNLDDIVDVENQIWVFWFVGIYKWVNNDELHLALKYCGQGVEGEHFQDFRPPSSFDNPLEDGEVRLVLKRTKPADVQPDASNAAGEKPAPNQ
jgi:hypothetical protein